MLTLIHLISALFTSLELLFFPKLQHRKPVYIRNNREKGQGLVLVALLVAIILILMGSVIGDTFSTIVCKIESGGDVLGASGCGTTQ